MFEPSIIIAAAALAGLTIVAGAVLRAWHGWLAFKRQELEQHGHEHGPGRGPEKGSSMGAARIELADLKERIKKLEAIASGVDL